MNTTNLKRTSFFALLLAMPLTLGATLSGCDRDPTVGERIDEGIEEVQDEIDDATTD